MPKGTLVDTEVRLSRDEDDVAVLKPKLFIALASGIAGAVLGMAQVWYIGVVAATFDNPFGGDVGFELALGFTLVVYPIARTIEKRITGR